ncbi:hypothetical protein [Streptomyces sp. NPDC008141]|uniref:hypothetical protein n=1 Tax=Streptomyces sp. NPDC008141 TaxID=3364815 RepID=UPI0036E3ABDE
MTPILLASACLLVVTLGYGSLCAGSPYGDCRKCRGMGHAIKTDRKGRMKRGKTCRRCRGYGKRIRVGRHLYNVWLRIHRAGTGTPAKKPAFKTVSKG